MYDLCPACSGNRPRLGKHTCILCADVFCDQHILIIDKTKALMCSSCHALRSEFGQIPAKPYKEANAN